MSVSCSHAAFRRVRAPAPQMAWHECQPRDSGSRCPQRRSPRQRTNRMSQLCVLCVFVHKIVIYIFIYFLFYCKRRNVLKIYKKLFFKQNLKSIMPPNAIYKIVKSRLISPLWRRRIFNYYFFWYLNKFLFTRIQ